VTFARYASKLAPVIYHVPSLVQHAKTPSTWGGPSHCAFDFDPDWRAD
jgi:hypothetical protein